MDRRPYIGRKPEKVIVAVADWLPGKLGICTMKWHPQGFLILFLKITGDIILECFEKIAEQKQYYLTEFIRHYFGWRKGGDIGSRKGL